MAALTISAGWKTLRNIVFKKRSTRTAPLPSEKPDPVEDCDVAQALVPAVSRLVSTRACGCDMACWVPAATAVPAPADAAVAAWVTAAVAAPAPDTAAGPLPSSPPVAGMAPAPAAPATAIWGKTSGTAPAPDGAAPPRAACGGDGSAPRGTRYGDLGNDVSDGTRPGRRRACRLGDAGRPGGPGTRRRGQIRRAHVR